MPKQSNLLWLQNFQWWFEYAENMQAMWCPQYKDLALVSECWGIRDVLLRKDAAAEGLLST